MRGNESEPSNPLLRALERRERGLLERLVGDLRAALLRAAGRLRVAGISRNFDTGAP